MSKQKIEVKKMVFDFLVNNHLVSIQYSKGGRTIVIFKGVTVYTSPHSVESIKQAEEMLYRYLDSIVFT